MLWYVAVGVLIFASCALAIWLLDYNEYKARKHPGLSKESHAFRGIAFFVVCVAVGLYLGPIVALPVVGSCFAVLLLPALVRRLRRKD